MGVALTTPLFLFAFSETTILCARALLLLARHDRNSEWPLGAGHKVDARNLAHEVALEIAAAVGLG